MVPTPSQAIADTSIIRDAVGGQPLAIVSDEVESELIALRDAARFLRTTGRYDVHGNLARTVDCAGDTCRLGGASFTAALPWMTHTMKCMATMAVGVAVAALAGCVKDLPGTPKGDYDPDSLPQTVAEAKAFIARTRGKKGVSDAPGNVRAEDYAALFGDTVFVINDGRPETGYEIPLNLIGVIFIGAEGRYVWCKFKTKHGEARTIEHRWSPHKRALGPGLTPIFLPNSEPERGGLSPLYDGTTGEAIFYTPNDGVWWDWNMGHHQERLPASTWTVCPDFPSAEENGAGVNERQTATTYPELLAQDPGRRILRPDLVTPNPVEPAK